MPLDLRAVASAIPASAIPAAAAPRPSAGQRACAQLLSAFGDGGQARVTSAASAWRQQYESTLRTVFDGAGAAEATLMVECLVKEFEARGFDWSLVRNALQPSLDALKQARLAAASSAITSSALAPPPSSAPQARPASVAGDNCALLLSKIPFDAGTATALKHVAGIDWQRQYATLLYQTMSKDGAEAGGQLFVCLVQGISSKAGASQTDVGNLLMQTTREVSANFLATHDTAPPVTSGGGGALVEPPVFSPSDPPVPPADAPPVTEPPSPGAGGGLVRYWPLGVGALVGYFGGYLLGRALR